MWSSPERPGAFGTPWRRSWPMRATISARRPSPPRRSTRNFRRALPRAFRFSSESRKMLVTAATTSGASSGETKMSTQRAKRGCGGEPAADAQVEALGAVGVDRGRERDVVDQAARAVLGAARDRHLVLARQVRVELVVQEVVVDRLGRRVAVDDLVMRQAGHGAADHVARDVAARAGGGQADLVQAPEDLRDVVERDPVDLEALARRAVDHAAAEVLGDRGHRLGLRRAQLSLDDLDAHHEMPVAGVVRVEAVPLEEADVVGVQRLPPLARGAKQLREYVEPVRCRLDAFDLAHGVRTKVPRSRSNHKDSDQDSHVSNPIGFVEITPARPVRAHLYRRV